MKNKLITIFFGFIALLVINFLAGKFHTRFDITEDQRYTLSETTKTLLKKINEPILIDVLLKGNFPSEFKRLQLETKQLLEEFKAVNPYIEYSFANPLKDEKDPERLIQSMLRFGLVPANVSIQENGKTSNETIFPWALATIPAAKDI